ncbi:hypothetical protein N431DRAFT_529798 [Stipitochalara longipes BDJ]|nr:hypothetical protein N431DRAFT_529798 [Stipitochalara longipes BDJ]
MSFKLHPSNTSATFNQNKVDVLAPRVMDLKLSDLENNKHTQGSSDMTSVKVAAPSNKRRKSNSTTSKKRARSVRQTPVFGSILVVGQSQQGKSKRFQNGNATQHPTYDGTDYQNVPIVAPDTVASSQELEFHLFLSFHTVKLHVDYAILHHQIELFKSSIKGFRPKITELMFSKEGSKVAQALQSNSLKSLMKNHEDQEIIFIPDLMDLNGAGWARLTELPSVARGNIRSIAFYVMSENLKYTRDDDPRRVQYMNWASRLKGMLQYLENVYLIIDVDRRFESMPPLSRAWRSIAGCKLAVLPGRREVTEEWVSSYAEGHFAKNQIEQHLRYLEENSMDGVPEWIMEHWLSLKIQLPRLLALKIHAGN